MTRILLVCLGAALLGLPAAAQDLSPQPRFQGVQVLTLSAAEREALDREFARSGGLGITLPPVTADSPRDSILFADREAFVSDAPPAAAGVGGPIIRTVILPSGEFGTGTDKQEIFHFQEPTSLDPEGPPIPLVMGYHGFGASANSVHVQSTLDEECEARGWMFVTPTGYDDKLFASPISQQHVDVVFEWLLDEYPVIDEDRLYMVGFSMGGGYVTSYAAQRRDPDELMIAAVGTVSAALDWTLLYATSGQTVKNLMELPQNFGGSPTQNAFGYQWASGLHYVPMSHPPLPGELFELYCMARNNLHMPVYQTYDTGDVLPLILPENVDFTGLMNSSGPMVELSVVSGTVDGEGAPAPHSWNVLDEQALFDFFELHSVERTPQDFRAMLGENGRVSWLDVTRRSPVKFAHFIAEADELTREISLTDVYGVATFDIDAATAGLTGTDPIRVRVQVQDPGTPDIVLRGFDTRPSYLVDVSTGEVVPGVESDPANDTLFVELSSPLDITFDVIQDPDWTATLTSTPDPVPTGAISTVSIDGPAGSDAVFLIVAFQEQLYTAKGVKLVALAVPPAAIKLFPNPSPEGDLTLPAQVPDDPGLSGLRLPLQSVSLGRLNEVIAVSNLWGVHIE